MFQAVLCNTDCLINGMQVGKSDWQAVQQAPPWAVDAWGLGCLMQEVYSGQFLTRTEELRNVACIPKAILPVCLLPYKANNHESDDEYKFGSRADHEVAVFVDVAFQPSVFVTSWGSEMENVCYQQEYQRLLASQPTRRLNTSKLAESAALKTKLVDTISFMESLAVKDSNEKDMFFKRLPSLLPSLPLPVVQRKVGFSCVSSLKGNLIMVLQDLGSSSKP